MFSAVKSCSRNALIATSVPFQTPRKTSPKNPGRKNQKEIKDIIHSPFLKKIYGRENFTRTHKNPTQKTLSWENSHQFQHESQPSTQRSLCTILHKVTMACSGTWEIPILYPKCGLYYDVTIHSVHRIGLGSSWVKMVVRLPSVTVDLVFPWKGSTFLQILGHEHRDGNQRPEKQNCLS